MSSNLLKKLILPTADEWFSRSRHIIGIMSGTSVDGVDLTLAKFIGSKSKNFLFSIISNKTYSLPREIKEQIQKPIPNESRTRDIAFLNFELAFYYTKLVKDFLRSINFTQEKIDAIGVHGQTLWHEPHPESQYHYGTTFQCVSLSAMAQTLGIPIVGDFRSKDVALGGEGAPLVPIFDYEFLGSKTENIIALNIGGIANITYIPKNEKLSEVVAFDTGPGNVWIDGAMRVLFQQDYDVNGEVARSGRLINQIFKKLKSIRYIQKKPPKSTGRELFNHEKLQEILVTIDNKKIQPNDIVTTLTHFTAWSIAENIKKFANVNSKLIVSGGGAKNLFLLELIQYYLPSITLHTSDIYGIPVEAKESLAFAFLAYLRMGGLPSNIPSVTGSRERISLGIVAV
ncbi:MAG: anhydro-N-acetylmuramic acid kinase [Candidatus Kapaibacteriota bacterium]